MENENAVTWADTRSSTIHRPYDPNELRELMLRKNLGREETP